MSDSKLVKDIVASIQKISDDLGIEPYQLTKAQFKELSSISEWDFRKVGGYQTLLTTYFLSPIKT